MTKSAYAEEACHRIIELYRGPNLTGPRKNQSCRMKRTSLTSKEFSARADGVTAL